MELYPIPLTAEVERLALFSRLPASPPIRATVAASKESVWDVLPVLQNHRRRRQLYLRRP